MKASLSSIKKIGLNKLLLILLAGVALIVIAAPMEDRGEKNETVKQEETLVETYEELLEKRLTEVLSCVEGVGKTKVMITMKATGEKIVLKETPYTRSETSEIDSEGGSRDVKELSQSDAAVYIEGNDGSRTPYVVQETNPRIEGVIVIAEGGSDIYTVKEIIEAVSALFDVPSHKIKVMKMKEGAS